MLKNKKGFTLIEAIVYLAIASILFVIIADIFITQSQVYDKETAKTDIDLYAKTALDRTVENSLSATTVVASRTFSSTLYQSGNQTLILELPSIDSNQNIINNTYDYILFHLDPNNASKFFMQLDAASGTARADKTVLLATFVSNLNFRYNKSNPVDANKVEVSLALEKIVRGITQRSENTTSLFLKNKF